MTCINTDLTAHQNCARLQLLNASFKYRRRFLYAKHKIMRGVFIVTNIDYPVTYRDRSHDRSHATIVGGICSLS